MAKSNKATKSQTQTTIEDQGKVTTPKDEKSNAAAVDAAKDKVAKAKQALQEATQAHAEAVAQAAAVVRQPGWSNSKPEVDQK